MPGICPGESWLIGAQVIPFRLVMACLQLAWLLIRWSKIRQAKKNNWVQGSRSGESTRFPPMWPEIHSQSSTIRGLSLFLVLYFAPRGFSLDTLGFALSSKSSISKFQFDLHSKGKGQKQIIFLSPAWDNWGMLISSRFLILDRSTPLLWRLRFTMLFCVPFHR